MRILLVEGHQSPASLLLNKLTASGYIVDFASNSRAVLELIASCDYDLIVLDAEALVPQFEGINLCRHLRSRGYDKLILLLIPENSSLDSVAGLDAGADDCIIKPYKLPELLAKIRALLRRRAIPLAPCDLIWGDLQMNLLAAEVIYQDQAIALTAKEYSLLKLFLSNPQRIFSRNAIIDQLWPLDASPGEGAVTNMIKNLRQKLKSSGVMEELLETVYGLGYRLKAPPRKSAKLAMRSGPSLTPGSSPEMPPREHRSETINPQTQQCYQLLVIDDDWEFIKQLKTEASGWGFQIEYITDTTLAGYWIAQHSPDLVLIDLSLIKPVAHHLVPELVAQFPRSLIILSVDRASLDERLMMSRLGIHYFLHKSVISISQIFGAALQVLSQFDPAPTRVMVIDEDSSGLEDQKKLLQLCGLQVITLSQPTQFWDILNANQPDLLLLDLEMETFKTIDLCQAVRQDLFWKNLPILVMTEQADMESLQGVLGAGASDFIRKPISEPELITRILSQIERNPLPSASRSINAEERGLPNQQRVEQYSWVGQLAGTNVPINRLTSPPKCYS